MIKVGLLFFQRRLSQCAWHFSHSGHLIEGAWQDKVDEEDAASVYVFALVLLARYVLKRRRLRVGSLSVFAAGDAGTKNDLLHFDQVDHFGNFAVDRVLRCLELRVTQAKSHHLDQLDAIARLSYRIEFLDRVRQYHQQFNRVVSILLLAIDGARFDIFVRSVVLF